MGKEYAYYDQSEGRSYSGYMEHLLKPTPAGLGATIIYQEEQVATKE